MKRRVSVSYKLVSFLWNSVVVLKVIVVFLNNLSVPRAITNIFKSYSCN